MPVEEVENDELSFEQEEDSNYEYDIQSEEDRINRDGSNSPIAVRFRDRRHLLGKVEKVLLKFSKISESSVSIFKPN